MKENIEVLIEENNSLKSNIKTLNAEKIAIDQICMNNIRENLQLRTQSVLLNDQLQQSNTLAEQLKEKLKEFEEKYNPSIANS